MEQILTCFILLPCAREVLRSELQPGFVHHTVAWPNCRTLTRNWCFVSRVAVVCASSEAKQRCYTWQRDWTKSEEPFLTSDSVLEYFALWSLRTPFWKWVRKMFVKFGIIRTKYSGRRMKIPQCKPLILYVN